MGVARWIGTGAVGLAGAGTVAYRVWTDPKVQKVRRRVVAKLAKQRRAR